MKWTQAAGFAACAVGLTGLSPADARPVSYPGGWTVMQQNNGDFSSLHVHYSPTFRDSIGLYSEWNWDEDLVFTSVQYNRLLKRWNGRNSQANTYLKIGAGQADPFGSEGARGAGFVAFAADWETRRWFIGGESRVWSYGGSDRGGASDYLARQAQGHCLRDCRTRSRGVRCMAMACPLAALSR